MTVIFICHYLGWILWFNWLWKRIPEEEKAKFTMGEIPVESIPNWALLPLLINAGATSLIHLVINKAVL